MTTPVDELLPKAREIAAETGGTPSQRRIKNALGVGAPKAREILLRLESERRAAVADSRRRMRRLRRDPARVRHLPARLAASGVRLEPPTPEPVVTAIPQVAAIEAAPALLAPPVPVPGPPVVADGNPVKSRQERRESTWWIWPIALAAAVSIWSGWVGLGQLAGFGVVHPLPGIWDELKINTAITLPIGMEAYAAGALKIWISGRVPQRARRFAAISAMAALGIGFAGQIAYHRLVAAGVTEAPDWIVTAVACLPVAVLGMAATLIHLIRSESK